jgi:hypothetical protein
MYLSQLLESHMTLNITLASPTGIHQSTDFRLMRPGAGGVMSRQSDASPKQVTIDSGLGPDRWMATIAYTGIGAWRTLDTCSWMVRWLYPSGEWPVDLEFEEAVERIRSEGTKWLVQISRPAPQHSFIIGGWVSGKPQVALISNFECLRCASGWRHPVGEACPSAVGTDLHVSRACPRRPMVVVTGQRAAVSATDRRRLSAMLGSSSIGFWRDSARKTWQRGRESVHAGSAI